MKEKPHSENVAELFRANLDASVDIDFERIAEDLPELTPEELSVYEHRKQIGDPNL